MATKKQQPVEIVLKIKDGEKLAALNRSFRDLSKQTKLADADIVKITNDVVKFAKDAGNSEATIKGQIKALEGLREQAAAGGKVYGDLSRDITELKAQLNGSTSAIDAQRKSLLEAAGSAEATKSQLLSVANALSALQKQTALGSKAFVELGADVANLEGKIAKVKAEQEELNRLNFAANQAAAGGAAAARLQIKAIDQKVASLREEKRALEELQGQERVRAGLKKILDQPGDDVPFRTREYIEEALRSKRSVSARSGPFAPKEIETAVEALKASVAELQVQIEDDLGRSARRVFQEMAREGRESARSLAIAFSGPEFERIFANLEENTGKLPNTTAGLSQRLRELERVLNNTERSSVQYRRVSEEISKVQKELAKDVYSYSEALENLARKEESAARRRSKLAGIGEYVGAVSGLGTVAAAERAARGGTPVSGQMRREGFPQGYRDLGSGAMIAPGHGSRRDRLAYQEAQEMKQIADLQKVINGLADEHVESLRSALRTMDEYEQKLGDDIVRKYEEATAAQQKAAREEAAREEKEYQRRIGIVRQMKTGEFASRRLIGLPRGELSGLYSGIAQIGQADQSRQLEMMGRSYDQVADDIRKVTAASNSSIASLNAQRGSWASLRNILDPSSKGFKEATAEIERLDRALEKTQRRRRRMSGMQMTQAAGAVLSGGIFGGPEGFLGGAIGALGGVGGAFAGAAIGAQVGGIRRTLGEYADYAAQIARLQIALEGISGSQAQYNRALAAAADVTSSLNVPQEVAIQGMTRLTAAVKGAGGGVADAELAFKNINSAIIATGGGAEQVQGAVTALVQIFSKGKVSAEEINQIAERLPGTFNKIAAASGRTGPELTKALQDGKVGLNDLMKFLVSLGDEYGELAEKIAGSSENAGARLQIAFNNMRIEVGDALQPIGAEFQDAFTEFIEDITPALVAALPKIGELAVNLAKNLDVLAAAALAAGAAMGVLAAKAAVLKAGTVAALFQKIAAAATAAGVATKGMSAAVLLNPYVAAAAGVAALITAVVKYNNQQRELNNLLDEGKGSTQEMKDKIQEYEDSITKATNKIKGINGEQKAAGRDADRLKKEVAELRSELERLKGTYKIRVEFERKGYRFDDNNIMKEFTVGNIIYGGKPGARAVPLRTLDGSDLSTFAEPDSDGGKDLSGGTGGGKGDSRIQNAEKRVLALRERLGRALRDAAIDFKGVGASAKEAIEIEYSRAMATAMDRTDDFKKQVKELSEVTEKSYPEIIGLVEELGLSLGRVAGKRRDRALFSEMLKGYGLSGDLDPSGKVLGSLPAQAFPAGVDSILQPNQMKQNIEELRTSLEELVDPVNQITNAATTIGEAFSASFTDAISGAKTAKEAFADFFRNVGNYFLNMAQQIIAKMIQIAILNTVAKVLPGLGSSGGSGFNLEGFGSLVPGKNFQYGLNNPLNIATRANGGPTYANRPYLIGERGPEIFVPSQSGRVLPNSSLGGANVVVNVDASGTNAQGDSQDASKLGNVIGAAVQSELIKQQRPGGLLAR